MKSFRRIFYPVTCQVPGITSTSSLTQSLYPYPTTISHSAALLIPNHQELALDPFPKEDAGCQEEPHTYGAAVPSHSCSHMSPESKNPEKSGQILLRFLCSAALVRVRITDLFKKHLQWNWKLISSGSKVNGGFFSPHRSVSFLPSTNMRQVAR